MVARIGRLRGKKRLVVGDVSFVQNAVNAADPAGTTVGTLHLPQARAATVTLTGDANGLFSYNSTTRRAASTDEMVEDQYDITFHVVPDFGDAFDLGVSITVDPDPEPPPPPGGDTLVTTLSMANWDGSNSSPGFFRIGLPFKKGDIPSTKTPVIKHLGVDLSAQFDERTTWTDGSLKFCVAHVRHSTFEAALQRDYEIYSRTGSYSNTGTKTLADLTAETIQVAVSSLTQYDGSTTVTRGSGAALADFNTHAAVATRVEKHHSGSVCEGWIVWGMFKDGADGSGAEDTHLKACWHIDIWKNADGSIADIEYACELQQNWWSIANKYRLNYTAVLKRGGSTIETYASVQHPYRSHWITVRKNADDGASRRFWKTAMPTLYCKPNKAYWISTNLMPPFDATFTPDAGNYSLPYVPCQNMNHRAAIDSTGGYMGRGLISNSDAVAFLRQTAIDTQYARTNSLAGLGLTSHYRSNRTRTRPGDAGADTANTPISLIMLPKSAAEYDFTADGMPIAVEAYAGSSSASLKDGYITPLGGQGVWTNSSDSSHAVNHHLFMYLLEGERYQLESLIDNSMKCTVAMQGTNSGGRSNFGYYTNITRRTAFGIPATLYTGDCQVTLSTNCRAAGWSSNLVGCAAAMVPDNHVAANFLRLRNEHSAELAALTMSYFPQSQRDAGLWIDTLSGTSFHACTLWHHQMVAIGMSMNYQMTENTDFRDVAEMLANSAIGCFENANYRANNSHSYPNPFATQWLAGTNEYFPRGMVLKNLGVTIDLAANTIAMSAGTFVFTNGDTIYFSASDGGGLVMAVPAAVSEGTPYYAVNSSSNVCQVSATPGGAAIDFTDITSAQVGLLLADQDRATWAVPPQGINADDFAWITYCSLVFANRRGNAAATNGLVDSARTFLGTPFDVAGSGGRWSSWRFARV